ncbi:unnamed protein product [Cochlearia groenlandica]
MTLRKGRFNPFQARRRSWRGTSRHIRRLWMALSCLRMSIFQVTLSGSVGTVESGRSTPHEDVTSQVVWGSVDVLDQHGSMIAALSGVKGAGFVASVQAGMDQSVGRPSGDQAQVGGDQAVDHEVGDDRVADAME